MLVYFILTALFVLSSAQTCTNSDYRSFDGSCNNQNNPTWGQSDQAFTRLSFPPEPFIAGDLPLPRTVSNEIGKQRSSCGELEGRENGISMFEPGFAQFVVHDIMFGEPVVGAPTNYFNDLTNDEVFGLQAYNGVDEGVTCTRASYVSFFPTFSLNPAFPTFPGDTNIALPPCNPFNPTNAPNSFLLLALRIPNFTRVAGDPTGIRNSANSWVDLSQIYGNSADVNSRIRDGAKLKLTNYNVDQSAITPLNYQGNYSFEFLPNTLETGLPGDRVLNAAFNLTGQLFTQGDPRAGENVMLGIQHYIWTKEHNYQVDRLQALNPTWTTEQLFQEARRYTIAVYQRVVYQEWLPQILDLPSDFFVRRFTPSVYNPNVDPTTSLISAVAAFRYGHSSSRPFDQLDACTQQPFRVYSPAATYNRSFPTYLPQGNLFLEPGQVIGLGQAFQMLGQPFLYGDLTPARVVASGASSQRSNAVANFVVSAMKQPAATVDTFIADELRNIPGLVDLFSTDFYRGREVGLPKYNAVRTQFLGDDLTAAPECADKNALTCFQLLTANNNVAQSLRQLYRTIDRVELVAGLLAERKEDDSNFLGPLTQEILRREFERKRDGDAFFYDRNRLSSDLYSYASNRPFKFVLSSALGLPTTPLTANFIFKVQGNGMKLPSTNPACSS